MRKSDLSEIRGGLGGTPLMRASFDEAAALVRAAAEGGIELFHAPTVPSAARIARGLETFERGEFLLAASVGSPDELERYFAAFSTDRIDFALVDPQSAPEFEKFVEAGRVGALCAEVRTPSSARAAAKSGRFFAVAMPFNCLASDEELGAFEDCKDAGAELFALEPLAGGLWQSVENAAAFFGSLGAKPLWGVQYMWQLEQLLALVSDPPRMNADRWLELHDERSRLAARYCRGCGECMPCPAGIDIPLAARMCELINSYELEPLLSAECERKMRLVSRCVGCGRCAESCRYHLPVRALMRRGAERYREFSREHGGLE